ncbi:hypothetical protein ASC68_09545 [Devosia sp. Root105]|nr:hypothetical protein ASC68_09545 [Devosia sp. Root105]
MRLPPLAGRDQGWGSAATGFSTFHRRHRPIGSALPERYSIVADAPQRCEDHAPGRTSPEEQITNEEE